MTGVAAGGTGVALFEEGGGVCVELASLGCRVAQEARAASKINQSNCMPQIYRYSIGGGNWMHSFVSSIAHEVSFARSPSSCLDERRSPTRLDSAVDHPW